MIYIFYIYLNPPTVAVWKLLASQKPARKHLKKRVSAGTYNSKKMKITSPLKSCWWKTSENAPGEKLRDAPPHLSEVSFQGHQGFIALALGPSPTNLVVKTEGVMKGWRTGEPEGCEKEKGRKTVVFSNLLTKAKPY